MAAFTDTIKSLGPARLAILGAVIVALMVFFIFIMTQISKPSMSMLYSDLTSVDSGQVAAKLEEIGVPYEISSAGDRISIPKNEIGRVRMLLAQEGLPNGGSMGYEIFDQQSGFGTTNFVQNINQVRALQGELGRTIGTLDPVQFAKVHLVLPQRELFSRDTRAASASVTLKLKPKARLSTEQIYGIQNLVANAVPDLKPERVTVIDTEANMLARGSDDTSEAMAGLKAEEMRHNYEQRATQSVEDLVGRIVGINKVRATVSAELNFDRISTATERYDPEGQVVRSVQTVEEGSQENDGQGNAEVSVENNLPGLAGAPAGGAASNTNQSNRTEETTNYEITKTVENITRESGQVKRLSVAVLVDGTYTTGEDGTKTYVPRSQKEIDQITSLVKSAIGFDAARGDMVDVQNMAFAEIDLGPEADDNTLFGFDKSEILDAAEMGLLSILGILFVLLVIKPIMTQMFVAQKASIEEARGEMLLAQAQANPALTGPSSSRSNPTVEGEEEENDSLIDMQAVEGKVKASTVKKVGDIVTSHPNETVSIIRNWMSQE